MSEVIVALMQEGKWEEVVFACQTALHDYPTNGKYQASMGEGYFQLGRLKDAEIAFRRAYTLDPTLWRAAVRHAQCLEKLHRYRDAMDVVKEWLKVKPGNSDLLGLQEFLATQHESEEHDAWERTRRMGVTIVNAGFKREDEPSVGSQLDANQEAECANDPAPSTLRPHPIKLQHNPGVG